MARAFTETWIKNLRPHNKRRDFIEPSRRGFMLRLQPGGAKTFAVRYQRDHEVRVMTLGEWPSMTLEEAHKLHTAARDELARGLDPIEERGRAQRAQERVEQQRKTVDAVTIRNIIAEFAWHHARRQCKRPRERIRLLKANYLVPLAGKPAAEITKRDLVEVIDRVLARGSRVMATRLRDLTVQAFGFAAERDLIPNSPAAGLRKRPGGEEVSRERALSRHEIETLWGSLALPTTKISAQVRLGLKLILVTAQRPGEVAGAPFAEFDTSKATWTIPKERAKNGVRHVVPLSTLAIELIEQLRGLAKGRPYLLPSVHKKLKPDEPISERALSRALKNCHSDAKEPLLFGLAPFTPHDLRRTAATHMTSLGIARLHVHKLLNHSDKKDITGVYDRHDYWPEKKAAVDLWAKELRSIIVGETSKVVAIRGRR